MIYKTRGDMTNVTYSRLSVGGCPITYACPIIQPECSIASARAQYGSKCLYACSVTKRKCVTGRFKMCKSVKLQLVSLHSPKDEYGRFVVRLKSPGKPWMSQP